MQPNHDSQGPTAHLLQQAAAMRSLGRSLLGDRDAATEAAHEVWLASRGSGDERSGAFVRTSLRNRMRDWRRSAARRTKREQDVATDPSGSADDIVAQAEVRQIVLEAVKSLSEPMRTTIWLRFFDDLPPRVIARRMQVPVATVRSRVRLGIEALRVRLDRLHDGDRRRWQAALLPAAGWPLAAVMVPVLGVVTMKKLLGLVAVLALAWFGIDGVLEARHGAGPASPPAGVAAAASEEPEERPGLDAPSQRVVAAQSEQPDASGFAVTGEVSLRLHEQGTRVAPGNGFVTLIFEDQEHRVPIEQGRFSFVLQKPQQVTMERLRLQEWSVNGPYETWQCSPEEAHVVLDAEAFPQGRLHVIDAATEQPLNGIDVVRLGTMWEEHEPDALGIPGTLHQPCLRDVASPCRVTGSAREGEYAVSAPGYAWRRFGIDHEHGGDQVVALERGGDLSVTIHHPPSTDGARVRVRDGSDCVRELLLPRSKEGAVQLQIDRLPVGPLQVAIEFGARGAEPGRRHSVATGDVTITAGGRGRLVLRCTGDGPVAGSLLEVRGTLLAGEPWGKTYSQIWLIPLDRAPLDKEVESTGTKRISWPLGEKRAWTCRGVRPGRYRLVVSGFGIEQDIEVRADANEPIDLVVPDPVESEVVVLQRGTRDPGHASGVYLMHHGPDGVGRFWVRGRYVDGSRTLLRSLPGDYELVAFTPRRKTKNVTVLAGSRHEVLVEPGFGTLLVFRSGGAHIPVDPAMVTLTPVGFEARVLQCVDVGFELSTHVTKKGAYRLQLRLPGYEPLDTEVTFGGGWGRTYIELQQK